MALGKTPRWGITPSVDSERLDTESKSLACPERSRGAGAVEDGISRHIGSEPNGEVVRISMMMVFRQRCRCVLIFLEGESAASATDIMGDRREVDRNTRRIWVYRLPSGDFGVLRAPSARDGSRPASQSPARAVGACSHRDRPACGDSAGGPVPATVETDECALVAAAGEGIATVGLNDRIDPEHAPHPANDSERLLFRQLYETLISVIAWDVPPGLATSWRLDADGSTWVVTLREECRFADGSPLTAADVRASWTRDGSGGQLRTEVARLVQSLPSSTTAPLRSGSKSARRVAVSAGSSPIWPSPNLSPIRPGRLEHERRGLAHQVSPKSQSAQSRCSRSSGTICPTSVSGCSRRSARSSR